VIEPTKFSNLEEFKLKFGSLRNVEELEEFKLTLKPYLMRRVKSDVEKSIPKLSEMLVTLDLTNVQR
jgi:SNF2 family DNA or RNA helicase